jgi:hypothetical protein
MKEWINKNYRLLIIGAFLIPIIIVAIVSISHVTQWYGISNPITWSVYLSIGIEIAALSSLAAISANMGRKIYFPFGIVTFVQFIGNIFFAYLYIDVNGNSFKSWVELVSPLVDLIGIDPTDLISHKRFLAIFSGGLLPLISLSFLHMLIKFTEIEEIKNETVKNDNPEKISLNEEDLKILLEELKNPQKPNEKMVQAVKKYEEFAKQPTPVEEPTKLEDLPEEILIKEDDLDKLERILEKHEYISEISEDDIDDLPEEPINEKITEPTIIEPPKEDDDLNIDVADETWDIGMDEAKKNNTNIENVDEKKKRTLPKIRKRPN